MLKTLRSSIHNRRRRSSKQHQQNDAHSNASLNGANSNSCTNTVRLLEKAPDEYGLLVTLDNEEGVRMEYVPDQHYAFIHPHGYGPASLQQLQLLSGGGSGVRVFAGTDPKLGQLVMKHGSDRDTKELFALTTISKELCTRSKFAEAAAQDMQNRIPDFRMIYISPRHLKARPKEFWSNFKSRLDCYSSSHNSFPGSPSSTITSLMDHDDHASSSLSSTARQHQLQGLSSQQHDGSISNNSLSQNNVDDTIDASTTTTTTNDDGSVIRLYKAIISKRKSGSSSSNSSSSSGTNRVLIARKSHAVNVLLGSETICENSSCGNNNSKYALRYGAPSEGYNCLKAFVEELVALQKNQNWKFTLAQQTIGGPTPTTAASHLANGNLHGVLLERLVDEYIHVIRNLQSLTRPEEFNVIETVHKELKAVDKDRCSLPFDISDEADAFVGFAIKKNWHPDTGRFFCLRRMGKAFRNSGNDKKLHLTEEEKLPARLLGILLKDNKNKQTRLLSEEVFVNLSSSPQHAALLEVQGYKVDSWRSLLKDATSLKSPAARDRLWNCGLADGGLHNMFLSMDRLLYLFDMGEPKLMPLPAFLTKFLFSFFHTLGMVDDKVAGRGWVNRFEPVQSNAGKTKLGLTEKTKDLLPQAYAAFKVTMDRLVNVFFVKEDHKAVRALLLNYVTLQLLSDAAFCLQRWTKKGGGQSRKANHHKHIEEWLWRSIWDIYIASDLNTCKQMKYLGVVKKKWEKR